MRSHFIIELLARIGIRGTIYGINIGIIFSIGSFLLLVALLIYLTRSGNKEKLYLLKMLAIGVLSFLGFIFLLIIIDLLFWE